MALALLPTNLILDGFNLLNDKVELCPQAEQLRVFVNYFEHEWLNNFKPSTWSVSKSNWRTNNFAEGGCLAGFSSKVLAFILPALTLVLAQNRRFFSRVVQPHPNLWRFIQCLKQEESVISHRMAQTGLGFSSRKATKSTRAAARKSKQIEKLLDLLDSKQRSLISIVMSLAYLVGEPVCRGRKGKKKKNNISRSNSSSSSNVSMTREV